MKWIKWFVLLVFLLFPSVANAKEISAEPIFKIHLYSHQKVIALTFDDGPHPFNTPKLLKVLQQEGVKATFFVLGKRVNRYPTILKRIVTAGHEIGNHGYSHRQFRKLTAKQLSWEIGNTDRLILRYGGKKPHSLRPPYGEVTPAVKRSAYQAGYKLVEWSIDPRDWEKGQTAKRIQDVVESHIQTGDIVLLHDGGGDRRETIKAVRTIIRDLKAKGYVFATITELLKMSGNTWE